MVAEITSYESPQLDSIEVEIEQGFNASGDPTITNPDMGWDY